MWGPQAKKAPVRGKKATSIPWRRTSWSFCSGIRASGSSVVLGGSGDLVGYDMMRRCRFLLGSLLGYF